MKRLSFSLLFLFSVLVVSAQLRWDVKAGMSVANMSHADKDAKFGYTVGLGADYAFSEMLSLQTGVNFTSKGMRDVDVEDDRGYYEKSTFKVFSHYAELPILAAVKFRVIDDFKVILNAGPYFAVGIGGKEEYSNTAFTNDDYSLDLFGDNRKMKRFDVGLQYGVGFEIDNHFLVNLTGQAGFITPYKHPYNMLYGDDGKSSKNLCFMLSVGYRF
ncbi:porin family protein [Bacteroides caecigallinarum]|nr:porin family protein [Bacteroides caecigallinarum]